MPDLAAAVRSLEAAERPRWVWADARRVYPALLAAGVRLSRCHDVALTEGLLLGAGGRHGEPRQARAAHARLRGLPVPEDPHEAAEGHQPGGTQASLFEPAPAEDPASEAAMVAEVVEDQLRRVARTPDPGRFRLLVAAESAGALVAAEMRHDGMPWREDVHDELLTGLLGPRPAHGMRPAKLQALADEVAAAFGQPVNPDSPQQIVRAFKAAGIEVPSTRSHVLKAVDHPAVAPLLAYKELSRLHSAHGWAWAAQWVGGGRLRPEYVVGGVVSGRWATSGGGALQIPKVMRRVVVADDGWTLVVADAAQLEPRVLAALSGDRGLARAAGEIDLYAALAGAFGGVRDSAKIAMLSAMYGGTSGDASKLLPVMRRRFPKAYAFVEDAARAGRRGGSSGRGSAAPARRRRSGGASWWPGRRARGRPGTGEVHPQLRRAGDGGRVGADAPRGAARAASGPGAAGVLPARRGDGALPARPGRRGPRGGRPGGGRGDPPAVRRHPGPLPDGGGGGRLLRRRQVTEPVTRAGHAGDHAGRSRGRSCGRSCGDAGYAGRKVFQRACRTGAAASVQSKSGEANMTAKARPSASR